MAGGAQDPPWAEPRPKRTACRRRWLRVALLVVVVGGLWATLAFVVEPVRVESSSMSPTYLDGDQVLVGKLGREARDPGRGQVIVLDAPGSDGLLVKRVAAVAGDTVGIEDGVLVVNGATVRESYVDQSLMDGVYFGPVTVPARSVFVLGDNRPVSVDSRSFGPVPLDDVRGRVFVRFWPLGSRGTG